MNRRDALRQAALTAAAAALWASLPSRTWAALARPAGWSDADEGLLTLIGDAILPATPDSPGAGSVAIGRFILVMLQDCQPAGDTAQVRRALGEIESASRSAHGLAFSGLSAAQRESVLVAYEASAAAQATSRAASPFRPIKELTLLGYFTSEAGGTRALRYDPVPGAFRGSIPLTPGDRSWLLP